MTPEEIVGEALNAAVAKETDGDYNSSRALRLAQASLAALGVAGYAITKLPEPENGQWIVNDDEEFTVSPVELVSLANNSRHRGCKVAWASMELNLCRKDASSLAAALLAAAAAAEENQ